MKELWVEKWRPKSLDGYVFRDEKQKQQVQSWVKTGAIPHLLFSGVQGSGKTTLTKVLLNELGVDWGDVLEINASSENGVDYIRDTINGFATSMPFGDFKYVLLDECDYLSGNAQAALRGVMERNSNTCRFLLTCNYPNKVIPAIHSRCQGFHIEKLDIAGFTARVATILLEEGVDFELDVLDVYIDKTYPDMRKCINLCQMNSQSGVLGNFSDDSVSESEYRIQMVALFKQRKYKEARELICQNITAEEYDEIYRYFYQNLHFWADDEDKENECILIIRNGLVKHISCADAEINLSATLTELQLVANS